MLKLFSPTLGQTDTLSGGQFFAVLRLVVHVEDGKDVDRGLAFVQGVFVRARSFRWPHSKIKHIPNLYNISLAPLRHPSPSSAKSRQRLRDIQPVRAIPKSPAR